MGLEPHRMIDALEGMLRDLITYKDREAAKEDVIKPTVRWNEVPERISD